MKILRFGLRIRFFASTPQRFTPFRSKFSWGPRASYCGDPALRMTSDLKINKTCNLNIKINEVIMPRDFKTFAEQNKKVVEQNADKVNEYQDIINKYKDMDQNSLMQNLFAEASKLKREGKLNAEYLNNIKNSISPFLNGEQQQMLNSLMDAINKN